MMTGEMARRSTPLRATQTGVVAQNFKSTAVIRTKKQDIYK